MERVCAVLAILCCLGVSSHAAEKVEMGFYSEALCPDCIALSNGPLKFAFDNVSWIRTPTLNLKLAVQHEQLRGLDCGVCIVVVCIDL